jgi:hypothetical protein
MNPERKMTAFATYLVNISHKQRYTLTAGQLDEFARDLDDRVIEAIQAVEKKHGITLELEGSYRARTGRDHRPLTKEESDLGLLPKLVLTRSDQGDGGWSLHPPGTTDEQIANGDVAPLATGESFPSAVLGKKWARPNDADYTSAYRSLLNTEIRRVSAFAD